MTGLSIARYRIELRLHHSARLQFRHEVMLHSLFSEALGKGELPAWVVPFASESGRTEFEPDDPYRIGLTVVGENADHEIARVAHALTIYGSRSSHVERTMVRWFSLENIERLPLIDVEAEVARFLSAADLALHFVSPLRMEIPLSREERSRKSPRFFRSREFPPREFLRLVRNRVLTLEEGRPPTRSRSETGLPSIPELISDPSELLWVDIARPLKASLGGVCGRLRLNNPGPEWLRLLVIGQYAHVGKSTGFGFGAYRIANGHSLWNDPFAPSRNAAARLADRRRLLAAAHHVAASTEGCGTDGMTPDRLANDAERIASETAASLRDGTYTAAPLLGLVLAGRRGKVRPLAVPTLVDRTVQRAALGILGPAVETLLEHCSFGYRRGFSRLAAAREIERAYAEGFRFVLDADIDSFFDSVDWSRLFARLDALYPFDPVTALLRSWVMAPVVFDGKRIERTRGLPQGAVISPLLANVFLDRFDEELTADGFRLVRYADDFVVLCRSLEAAEAARDRARAALQELGLILQEEKTTVVSMDDGFTYLGYLFCRSARIDHRREATAALPEHPRIPASSWLAAVDVARVRPLGTAPAEPREAEVVPLHGAHAPGDGRRPLYVADPAIMLHLEDHTLVVEKEGTARRRIALRTLSQVVFIGRPRATLPLVLELGLSGIPVFFCRRNGELEAVHGPFEPDVETWLAQARASKDESLRLAFAQEVVSAKLHNYATMAVRHGLRNRDAVAGQLRELERSVWNKTDVDSVRGLEGAGGAAWFSALGDSLPGEWRFTGRIKRPPRGPYNAMLSFGYTLLHHHCAAALWGAGLVPRIGLFHREHGTWAALASDLQEEFRYLVDGLTWSMVKRGEIRAVEFEEHEDGCWMNGDSRRRFVEAFEDRLETRFRPAGAAEPLTYREAIAVQGLRVRDLVHGRARYEAVRAHG